MAITQVKSKQQFLVTDNVSFQSAYRITNLVDPTNAQDAATKAYVDAVKQALDIKDSARVATTGAETYTISGGAVTQITGTSIDGVSLAINDRILIKNAPASTGAGAGAGTTNTTQPANGIYVVTGNTTNLTVQRAIDADVSADVTAGMFVFVAEGTANADNGYVLTTNDAITLNTTGLTFTQFSGAGQISAGAGLTKTGNTIDVVGTASRIVVNADSIDIASDYVGQTSIVTLGTVTTGTWSATTIAANKGGTGFSSYAVGDLLYADTTSTLAKLADVATGNALISGGVGVAPSWGKIGLTTHISGTLAAGNGGTGQSTYAVGDILYANTTSSLAKLADVATGNVLISGGVGVAPSWGKVGLTTHVSGTLPVGSGGTGATTLTGILIGNGTSAITAISSVTALQVLRVNAGGNGYEFATVSFGGGSVTDVSVTTANGFAGTVATSSTTPAITLTTTQTGVLVGDGTAMTGVAGTASQLLRRNAGNTAYEFFTPTYLTSSNKVTREVPSGTVNGTNPTFTLAFTPTAGTEHVYVNGVLMNQGAGNDYTISSATITFLTGAIPQTGDVILVSYLK